MTISGCAFVDCRRQRRLVLQHADVQAEIVAAFEQRAAPGLQALIVEGGEPVKAIDDVAVGEQSAAEMEADKAGGAGNENPHGAARAPDQEGPRPTQSGARAQPLTSR